MTTSRYTPAADLTSEWTLVGAATHAGAVSADDGDASYIVRTFTQTGLDVWSGSYDVAIPAGATIDMVTSSATGRTTIANIHPNTDQTRFILRLDGVDHPDDLGENWNDDTFTPSTHALVWTTNPATGRTWRAAELIAPSFGGIGITKLIPGATLGQIRITRVYLLVVWTAGVPLTAAEVSEYWRMVPFMKSGHGNAEFIARYLNLIDRAVAFGQDLGPPQPQNIGTYDPWFDPNRRRKWNE